MKAGDLYWLRADRRTRKDVDWQRLVAATPFRLVSRVNEADWRVAFLWALTDFAALTRALAITEGAIPPSPDFPYGGFTVSVDYHCEPWPGPEVQWWVCEGEEAHG